jgi:hypothetical protein
MSLSACPTGLTPRLRCGGSRGMNWETAGNILTFGGLYGAAGLLAIQALLREWPNVPSYIVPPFLRRPIWSLMPLILLTVVFGTWAFRAISSTDWFPHHAVTHDVVSPIPSVSTPQPTAPKPQLPLRPYYSFKKKEEMVNGLHQLEKFLAATNAELLGDIYTIQQSSINTESGSIPVLKTGRQDILNALVGIQNMQNSINKLRPGPDLGNQFLDDPAFDKEANYVRDLHTYFQALNEVIFSFNQIYATMQNIKQRSYLQNSGMFIV